ncbi:hypothetical protein COM55_06210 [Bacillus pseudomycoides]|nr:hypothetical protein CN590_18050 [Bacillus pseudomycoides]PGE87368.1 hypothetical protein COM55_06210 [Bacillus pseudomycoides]
MNNGREEYKALLEEYHLASDVCIGKRSQSLLGWTLRRLLAFERDYIDKYGADAFVEMSVAVHTSRIKPIKRSILKDWFYKILA